MAAFEGWGYICGMIKSCKLLFVLLGVLCAGAGLGGCGVMQGRGDAAFGGMSEEYLQGYLAARPESGTSLGLWNMMDG